MDQRTVDSDRRASPECRNPSSSDCEVKSCGACRTTETPLWRSGPAGPKTLCNACGIRYRKNKTEPGMKAKKEKKEWFPEVQMPGLGLRKKRSVIQKHWRRWWRRSMIGEEEQAAVLLMALSYGLI
ncbi:GATA transcription factor 15-like [Curcuma longa]|uniref:GATA transcription factor 15-like n=1 Tax=Curcuma longa TaxID=136217 RepID=UPI003D9E6BBD